MTNKVFREQMEKLKTQWKNSYGDERMILFWEKFKSFTDEEFTAAVASLLLTRSAPPLGNEIIAELEKIRRSALERKALYTGPTNMLQVIRHVGNNSDNIKREYIDACIDLFTKFSSGKLNRKQFDDGLEYLKSAARKEGDCWDCGNSGYVNVDSLLFRCRCPTGARRPPSALGPKRGGVNEELPIPLAPIGGKA